MRREIATTAPSAPSVPSATSAMPALSALVVTTDPAGGTALVAAANSAGGTLRVTHALTLPSALATLASASFDCVLADLGSADVAAVEVVHALRRRSGAAAVVVLVDGDGPGHHDLEELADAVLRPDDLARAWLTRIRRCADHARLRAELGHAEQSVNRLTGVIDSVTDAVLTTTLGGMLTSWNAGAEAVFGYSAEDVIGSHLRVLYPTGSDEPEQMLAMVGEGEQLRGLETVRRSPDGALAEISVSARPLHEDGVICGMVVVARSLHRRRGLEADLTRFSMRDTLTGLPNRSYLLHRLEQTLRAAREDHPIAVLYVDLDQFRAVGDVHGHRVGDRVLERVAERMRRLSRQDGVVARVGGDEFVLVCPGVDAAAARILAERVIGSIRQPILVGDRGLRLGASIGIAVAPPVEHDPEMLLKHAEAAVGEAKSRGRARSHVFDPARARRAGEMSRLAADLRDALHLGELEVHYQPVVDIRSDELTGVEALARWRHPTEGTVSPTTFVTLAETHGFITELDRFVLDRACHETVAAIGAQRIRPAVRVAVNLSARTLDDPDLVGYVDDVVRRSGLPADSLILEVTETALLENLETARSSLEGLRELGTAVYLDDFGTGYSSLSFLRDLPVDGVKVDRSFVRDAVNRPEDLAITEAIVRLARGLGLETVAEGIETVEQRDLLRRLGCAAAQGYWWSPAVPIVELGDPFAARLTRQPPAAPRRRVLPRRQLPPPQVTRGDFVS